MGRELLEWLTAVGDQLLVAAGTVWIYPLALLASALDGVFPPVPSETVVVTAAAVGAATGSPVPWIVGVLAAVGAFAGDAGTYLLGRAIGLERFRWMRTVRGRRALGWAQRGLARRGASLILIARYIPMGRVAVNLTAGATRYPPRRFFPLAALAAVVWAAYSVTIGVIAGNWFKDAPLLGALLGVVIAVCLGVVIDRLLALRARRAPRDPGLDPAPVPPRTTEKSTV
ncbi:DedA family protein [Microbacterium album]|uniref:VTT domain-containing protein n=1 Tax=Microbacterium album TaxID=2053191 RepID=A0A917IGF6_9MICO|nr:VTT domain-containing protein [Microbacterium album]GGH43821.1 hypothetical protein GCM10010921_18080 [Microbacterium album]